MWHCFRTGQRAPWFHRTWTGLALAAYLTSAVGMPVPQIVPKRGDQPFPCQHHACGCATAEDCWAGCCCYTQAQKLAWAKEHGVTPPASPAKVIAGASQAGKSLCCASKSRRHSCCASCKKEKKQGAPIAQAQSDNGCVKFVLAVAARRCRGIPELWTAVGATTAPCPPCAWQPEWIVLEWLSPCSVVIPAYFQTPPVPPPRCAELA